MPLEQSVVMTDLAGDRSSRFYGKYRGIVKTALTGSDLGKLEVLVPDVLGQEAAVAWPCVPFAGPKHGFVAIPEEGDGVWVEFEGGHLSQAIWVGCWWGDGDMPSPSDVKVRTLITTKGLALVMDDDAGELTLKYPDGPSIKLDSNGITLSTSAATITLDASGINLKGNTQVSQ